MTGTTPAAGQLPRKLDGLQVGRAIAAGSVVVSHAVGAAHGGHAEHGWHLMSRYGVTLFFVISGFIMVHTTGPGSFGAAKFMGNRLRRIVPIYVVANLLVAVLTIVMPQAFKRTQFDLTHIILSLLFIPAYDPSGSGEIWPFFRLGWTLNYEMFFYVCFAALAGFSARARAGAIAAWFVGLTVLGTMVTFSAAIPRFYTQPATLAFVGGVLLGLAGLEGRLRLNWAALWALVAVSLAGLVVLSIHMDAIRTSIWTDVATFSICMVHIAALVLVVDVARVGAPRWLTFLGDSSYSLYLFHMFSVGAVFAIAHKVAPTLVVPTILVAIGGSLVAAAVAYLFIEQPLNRLFRRNRPLTAAQIDEDAATARRDAHAPRPR
jgi:exopolysaccharide production protein ExoZ